LQDKFRRDGTPYPEGDAGLFEWAHDMENRELRRVALDKLANGVEISTVWLGLNHRYGVGRPLIFETMLFVPQKKVYYIMGRRHEFDREEIGEQWRYSTEEEAVLGHKMLVKKWKLFKTAEQVLSETPKERE
jgi:hypothetical protein